MNIPHPLHQIGRLTWSFVESFGMKRVPGLCNVGLFLPTAFFFFSENPAAAVIDDLRQEQNPKQQSRNVQNHEPQDSKTGLHGSDIQMCEAGNETNKASTACC